MESIRFSDPIDLEKSSIDNKKLLKHQDEAINALDSYFDLSLKSKEQQNGMLVMPTGSGKTFTAVNWLLKSGIANGFKIVWLVHRQELVEQANRTFREQSPLLNNYGFKKFRVLPISGSHYSMSQASRYDAYICSIGSVASKNGMRYIRRMLGTVGQEKLIVIIDEAHHGISPSYQKVLKRITEINPKRILLGLTATPTRMQDYDYSKLIKVFNIKKNLESGKGTKNGYVYEVTLKRLLVEGFLAQPVYKRIETHINGEIEYEFTEEDENFFNKFGELSEAIKEKIAQSSSRNKVIIEEYLKNKEKYGKTLVFAVNKLHCKTLYEEFKKAKISCNYCISGEGNANEVIKDFKNNKFDVLINVQILTEGSDVPDIQTVFLTRQTNSESLLVQMIGRGLRGVSAGGTNFAYIVDFHDSWDKFNFWIDPEKLPIIELAEKIVKNDNNIEEIQEDNNIEDDNIEYVSEDILNDIYRKIYNAMKSNLLGISRDEIFPNGWYSIGTDEGKDIKVIVYDNQLDGFKCLEEHQQEILEKVFTGKEILKRFFDITENLPKENDIELILHSLYENNEMPEYYTFTQRDELDCKKIAKKLDELDFRRSEEEKWLENLYESKPILKELYKSLIEFKKNINDARYAEERLPDIITFDDRENYEIEENIHDLQRLRGEVIRENKILSKKILPVIRWTNKPLRSYFGMCTKYGENDYLIKINKLLSSSKVSKDILKYLIYHELLHANGYWNHDEVFRSNEWRYPNSAEYDGFLDEISNKYNVERYIPVKK